MMRFTFHSDPGHGWLEAPRSLIDELGIADKISHYSYQGDGFKNPGMVYLEEDQDAGILIEALKAKGVEVSFCDQYSETTFIRDLPSFKA